MKDEILENYHVLGLGYKKLIEKRFFFGPP